MSTRDRDEQKSLSHPKARSSTIETWFARALSTPSRRWFWYWGAPIAITVLAGFLRFWNLGHPHSLVFDETFYVKDAFTLLHNGYESTWPENADTQFNSGNTNIFTNTGSYVVHPPLGKWIIAAPMMIFGASDSFWWRAGTAITGTLLVLLIQLITRKLFASTTLALIAGFLLAIDGEAIVMSRVALLDISLAFFVSLGFLVLLYDRASIEKKWSTFAENSRLSPQAKTLGPSFFFRPWLVLAAILFGMACSVKWSGAYFLGFFFVWVVLYDLFARKRNGVAFWASGALLKQAPITALLLFPVALATYLSSWTGWLTTRGGYDRNAIALAPAAVKRSLSWLPEALQNLWLYHQSAYNYHITLRAEHAYNANPFGWLALLRPTSMFYEGNKNGEKSCHFDQCSQAITSLANPLIWWTSVLACFVLIVLLLKTRQLRWQSSLILTAFAAGYLPWLLYWQRTVFQFYTIAFLPFMILAFVAVLWHVLRSPRAEHRNRDTIYRSLAVFLGVCLLLTLYFYSIWTAQNIPFWLWESHMWLPSWR